MPSTTQELQTRFLREPQAVCKNKIWLNFQFAKNILKTLIETGFTTAFVVTDGFGLEAEFYEMSYAGIGIAFPLAIYFSLCESFCHDSKSQLVEQNNSQSELVDLESQLPSVEIPEVKLSLKQHLLAKGHFVSDIFGDVETLLMPTKILPLGMKTWHPAYRALAYAAFGLFGWLGNVEEYKNSVTAFLDQNKLAASRGP